MPEIPPKIQISDVISIPVNSKIEVGSKPTASIKDSARSLRNGRELGPRQALYAMARPPEMKESGLKVKKVSHRSKSETPKLVLAKLNIPSVASNSESYIQMYGKGIMDNIQKIIKIDTTGTKSELHRFFDEETNKNYYVKVIGAYEGEIISTDSSNGKPPEIPIEILETKTAPWFERVPETTSAVYGKRLADHYSKMAEYQNLNIPPTRIISIKLENGLYRHVILQEETPGQILRRHFPHCKSSMGEEAYERSMFEQIQAAYPESVPKLRSLTLDLINLFNKDHFIPDLNYGVLSTDNILFDTTTGNFSLVDIDDHYELPKIFTDQLEPGELLMSKEGKVNQKLVNFIQDNSQYDEPYMEKLQDWLKSLGNILLWSNTNVK